MKPPSARWMVTGFESPCRCSVRSVSVTLITTLSPLATSVAGSLNPNKYFKMAPLPWPAPRVGWASGGKGEAVVSINVAADGPPRSRKLKTSALKEMSSERVRVRE